MVQQLFFMRPNDETDGVSQLISNIKVDRFSFEMAFIESCPDGIYLKYILRSFLPAVFLIPFTRAGKI